ncbi:MAG: hypothetical protein FJ033_03615 [Chloroflexi bacterium]|nr:hypothetical protein [Chloroflexota bacterium]
MLARLARLGLIAGLIALVVLPGVAAAQTATKMTFTFGPGRNATQAGTVTLEPMGAQTKVTIDVASGGAGVSQPAHIHTGACPGVGAVAFPLTNVVDGKSETTVNVTAAQIMATAHSINIHRSTTEAAVFTACADLPLVAATLPRTGGAPLALYGLLAVGIAGIGFALRRRSA